MHRPHYPVVGNTYNKFHMFPCCRSGRTFFSVFSFSQGTIRLQLAGWSKEKLHKPHYPVVINMYNKFYLKIHNKIHLKIHNRFRVVDPDKQTV